MNRTISLDSHYDQFIDEMVKSGRFSNPAEVVMEGLKLLERSSGHDRLEATRALIDEGLGQAKHGQTVSYDSAEALAADIMKEGQR